MGLAGCVKREIKNIGSRGKNIICFGDSVTFGYGVTSKQSYPSILAKMSGLSVVNAGIDGDTSTEALKRIKPDVLDKEPLLVIIEFGGNDFLRKIPLIETARNVEEMVKSAQSKGAMVAIADVSVPIVMDEYRREFKRLSSKYNAIFIPGLLKKVFTDSSLKGDFIHPNASGYDFIARHVYRRISPYLGRNAVLTGRKN